MPQHPQHRWESRVVRLVGPIDDAAAQEVIGHLLFARKMGFASELTLEIDSPGGEVNPGIAVYDVLAEMQPPPVTSGINLVSGMALLILAAGRRGNRRLRSNTHLSFASLSSERPEADVGSANATLAGLLSRNSSMDAAEVAMRMASSGALTPAEAVVLGLADRVDNEFQPHNTRP